MKPILKLFSVFFAPSHTHNIERVWMVQTESQYICIHQCLLTVLEGNESTNSISPTHVNQGYEGMSLWSNIKLIINNHLRRTILFLVAKEI